MNKNEKKFFELCTEYNKWTNITIEFLVSETTEHSADDYAPNKILKCDCKKENQCTRPRHECPIWKTAKW